MLLALAQSVSQPIQSLLYVGRWGSAHVLWGQTEHVTCYTHPNTTPPPCRIRPSQEANNLEHPPPASGTDHAKEEGLPVEVTEAFNEFEFLNNEDGNDSSDDGKCSDHTC